MLGNSHPANLVPVLIGHVDRGNIEGDSVKRRAFAQVLCELCHHFLDVRRVLNVVRFAQVKPDFAVGRAAITLKSL